MTNQLRDALPPLDLGHGHVRPNKNGLKARCGGPAICNTCRKELEEQRAALAQPIYEGFDKNAPSLIPEGTEFLIGDVKFTALKDARLLIDGFRVDWLTRHNAAIACNETDPNKADSVARALRNLHCVAATLAQPSANNTNGLSSGQVTKPGENVSKAALDVADEIQATIHETYWNDESLNNAAGLIENYATVRIQEALQKASTPVAQTAADVARQIAELDLIDTIVTDDNSNTIGMDVEIDTAKAATIIQTALDQAKAEGRAEGQALAQDDISDVDDEISDEEADDAIEGAVDFISSSRAETIEVYVKQMREKLKKANHRAEKAEAALREVQDKADGLPEMLTEQWRNNKYPEVTIPYEYFLRSKEIIAALAGRELSNG